MEKGVEPSKLYSHSRLWLYENCSEAFKAKYIDKVFPDIPGSIEAFLGGIVHESLEWLYKKVQNGWTVHLDDLIRDFAERWKSQFAEDLRITNGGDGEFYFNKGIKFLIDYFQKHKPFEDNTIHIEKRIVFPLDSEGKYGVQGYIDRIVKTSEGTYEVHDYKTNSFMKRQDEVDKDRQLAFYHLGLQKLFGKQITVKLIWHFLAHDRSIESRRTQEELDKLKEETLELIKKIESTQEWRSCGRKWCDWCSWKKMNGLDRYTNGDWNNKKLDEFG